MNTPNLVVAAALTLSTGTVSATAYSNSADAGNAAAMSWRSSPAEVDSFAGVVATGATRSWSPPAAVPLPVDAFETDRRGIDLPLPPRGDVSSIEANPMDGIIPVPEPSISTMLLAGLGAIGLIGLRRRIH